MAKFNGFNGNYNGLSTEEVKRLHDQYGKNELVPEKKETGIYSTGRETPIYSPG